jgi:hypothetical protein
LPLSAAFAEFLRQRLPPEASIPTDARENRFGLAFETAIEGARSDNLSDVRFRVRRGT